MHDPAEVLTGEDARLRAALDAVDDLFNVLDGGRLVAWNTRMSEVTGVTGGR